MKHQAITPTDICTLLNRYWQNSDAIWDALPLTVEGVTYTHWWQLSFEDRLLPACRANKPGELIQQAYIVRPLEQVWRALKAREVKS